MKAAAIRSWIAAAIVMLGLGHAWAQEPFGAEFQVNTFTPGHQIYPAAAADEAGNFVVVWMGYAGSGGTDIFGQLFDPAGRRRGTEFVVNTSRIGIQGFPAVTMKPAGDFVVAWMSNPYPYGGAGAIHGQRYDAAGARLGGEFVVRAFAGLANYLTPSISSGAAGGFVVAWAHGEIFARRYDAAGAPLGAEVQVNTYTTGMQTAASVASDAAGNFVVTWHSWAPQDGVFAQRFDASGSRLGSEFRVGTATFTAGGPWWPSVAVDEAGNATIAWEGPDGSEEGIFVRRYDAGGAEIGAEFRANPQTAGDQGTPVVAAHADGRFIVSWFDEAPGQPSSQIIGQRYDAAAAPIGGAFRADTLHGGVNPAIAVQPAGNFVMAWESAPQDGSGKGIFARRWIGLVPAALAVDVSPTSGSDGNGVLEPGELVSVAPSWRNAAGAARTFQGEGIAFSGPAGGGPVYGLVDGSADYGTLADGATVSCQTASGNCYVLSVSMPSGRPAVHWDATFDEALRPQSLAQWQGWSLHLGRSFEDVPASSMFYRAVETVLHRGITAGCDGVHYCPAGVTTREQMAVFVLVAKEGAGHSPPACTTPVFADVPASSPFCRWIEELARRGVVSGCGGGNYCPMDAVSREQMAVFVLRTLDPALIPPACTTPVFADVPASSPFCRWVEELARRGVVTGCGGGNYCPTAPVTREQMSVFLTATFGLTLYGP